MNTRALILGVSLLSFSSCIFETRTPENPAEPSANFKPPTEASDVFTNMEYSFGDKNSVNYRNSFADSSTAGRSFAFEPSSQALSKYGVFLGWSRQSEEQYFNNIIAQLQPSSIPSLSLNIASQSVSTDSAFFEATYQLTVPHTRSSIPQTALGRAQFYLIKNNVQNWVIWRWVDLANQQGEFTWSDLKGEERSSRQLLSDGEMRLLQQVTNVQEAHNDNYNYPAFADGYWPFSISNPINPALRSLFILEKMLL